MSGIKKKELADLVDTMEASYTFSQPQPIAVEIDHGNIRVSFMLPSTGWLDSSVEMVPLANADLFMSFANLAAHGKPSKWKIMNWVSRFGLPAWGRRGAISMTVEDFEEEARYAHDLRHIYLSVRNEKTAAIRERIKNPQSRLDHQFREGFYRNRRKWGLFEGRRASQRERDTMVLLTTQCALGEITTNLVSNVRPRAGIQRGWFLTPSWECHDLPSALYLQFYLLVTRHKPLRYCEFCGQPFEVTRDDKIVCNSSCRSGLRYRRSKSDTI